MKTVTALAFKRRINDYCRRNKISYSSSWYGHSVLGFKVDFDEPNQYVIVSHYDALKNIAVTYSFPYESPKLTVFKVSTYRDRLTTMSRAKIRQNKPIPAPVIVLLISVTIFLFSCSPVRYGCQQTQSYTGYHPTTKKAWLKPSSWYPFRRN